MVEALAYLVFILAGIFFIFRKPPELGSSEKEITKAAALYGASELSKSKE